MIRVIFLYPLSILVGIIIFIRNKLYTINILPSIKAKVPVISVGNIQIGGTGKTPFVISLAQQLISHNINPLIITRGYKRTTNTQIILDDIQQYTAIEVGDEPYYIKQVLKNTPIIVDFNKKRAIKCANQMSAIDCILLDDGYQSRYIHRDIDIVLINTWISNKYFSLFPFGSLRESIINLNRADFIYTTKGSKSKSLLKIYDTQHINIDYKIIQYNNNKLKKNVTIKKREDEQIVAFCGIANAKHFFEILDNLKIDVDKKIVLNNHYRYNQNDDIIQNQKKIIYVTTHKDFFKLNTLQTKIYVIDMTIIINDMLLLKTIKQKINENK